MANNNGSENESGDCYAYFRKQYTEKALSILSSIKYEVENGNDALGFVGALVMALADIRKVNAEIERA